MDFSLYPRAIISLGLVQAKIRIADYFNDLDTMLYRKYYIKFK